MRSCLFAGARVIPMLGAVLAVLTAVLPTSASACIPGHWNKVLLPEEGSGPTHAQMAA